ncbi:MAG: YbaB/EbfC family nucleoid-associated protein [Phycisphaerae bacterium]|nr:YbaB/EbfC family nucleoid-associated protein [Phycisphaerae bacterium]
MFDSLRNIGSMAGLMKDMPKIRAKLEEVRAKAETTRVAASSGGGAVTVVSSGKLRIESIDVDPIVARSMAGDDPVNRALAIELIREATNSALDRAQAAMAESLAGAARELNLPISAEQLKELL